MSRCFFINKFPKISIARHFIHMALTILAFYATIEAKRSKTCPFFKFTKRKKIQIFFWRNTKKC